MELIDRNQLVEIVERQGHIGIDDILSVPAVAVGPVARGWWIDLSKESDLHFMRSACSGSLDVENANAIYPYCPKCGAKIEQPFDFLNNRKGDFVNTKELKSCRNCTSAYRWDETSGGSVFRCKDPLSGAYNTPVTDSECCDRYRKSTADWIKYLAGK